jgi:hypothetical protein
LPVKFDPKFVAKTGWLIILQDRGEFHTLSRNPMPGKIPPAFG